MTTKIEKVSIAYRGKLVEALKLIVTSEMPIDIDTAWTKLKTSKLLEFVSEGKVRFKPTGGYFPAQWKQGETLSTKMAVYGFVPFGGLHSLYFEKIDELNKVLQTREWDRFAKVWDHKISLRTITGSTIMYEDEVVIYAGILTGLIALWARSFYQHRQNRWQLIAANPILVQKDGKP